MRRVPAIGVHAEVFVVVVAPHRAAPTAAAGMVPRYGAQAAIVVVGAQQPAVVLDFVGAQPHRHAAADHVRVAVAGRFGDAVVPDLAAHAEAAAAHAAAGAGAALVRVLPAHFPHGARFGGFLLGQQPWVLVLRAVAPDGRFLLPHQGDVARGRG